MKIAHKAISGFVGIGLLVYAVGYLAVSTSQKSLQKTIGQGSVTYAESVIGLIDRSILNNVEYAQAFSTNSTLQDAIKQSNDVFSKLDDVQSYIDSRDIEWISAEEDEVTVFMDEIIKNGPSEDLRGQQQFFKFKHGHDLFSEIFVTNKYGANIAQTGKTTDYRQNDESWWQKAKSDGLYIGDVSYDRSAGVYALDVGIGISDNQGQFLGVLKAVLNIEDVIRILKEEESESSNKSTEFKLLTKDCRVIYSSEEYAFFDMIYKDLPINLEQTSESSRRYLTGSGDEPGEGDELYAWARSKGYKDFAGLGWVLIVEHDTDEIFAPTVKLRGAIKTISLVVTAIALFAGLVFSRSISKPLYKLRKVVAEIGKGNLGTKVKIESNDEVGELSEAFNKMVEDLRQSSSLIGRLHTEITKCKEYEGKLGAINHQLQGSEEQLKVANSQLHEEIEKRDEIEKQQERLLVEIAAANQDLKSFAYIVSHDLKAPLRGIKTIADLLSTDYGDRLGAEGKEQLQMLINRISLMNNLIDGILSYSRIGITQEEHVEVDVNKLVREVIEIVTVPIHISIKVEGELPVIACEKTRIQQVFQNLLSNAVKYMDKSKGHIVIDCIEDGEMWQFSVKDNGPGIEKKYHEKIFEMFQTLGTKDEFGGTGVGLALVKKVVEHYGGKVWVESKVGKGSTFLFTLPKVLDAEKVLATAQGTA